VANFHREWTMITRRAHEAAIRRSIEKSVPV
jgi:hypothetical protein